MDHKRDGLANYESVSDDYLQQRTLRKSANWLLLWAMGVGAVISGDFFGWNFGLAAGGFQGLAIATALMAVMYVCMVFSIAELSAALPHAGGFYSFVRNGLGPTAGYVCGVTDTIEYVLTPAVIVVGIGGLMDSIVFGSGDAPAWSSFFWWIAAYAIFLTINIAGAELTLRVCLVITALAAAVLIVFYSSVLVSDSFDHSLLYNAPVWGASADSLPRTPRFGVFAAIPFAIWFYLAIEQLPLAAEESHDVVSDMPKALIWGIVTLLVLSLFTLVLCTGVGGGALAMSKTDSPLADGFIAVFGVSTTSRLLMLAVLAGFLASFHSIIYAYGRVLFSLSRAGYFPRWISVVNARNTPGIALILGAIIGLGCAVIIHLYEQSVGAVLLNMAVFGAVVSYALVMISYVALKIRRPDLKRPYVSPLGIPGAVVGALLSFLALLACFADSDYRPGVYGTGTFLAIALVYFFTYSRRRLVAAAPEEKVALSKQSP